MPAAKPLGNPALRRTLTGNMKAGTEFVELDRLRQLIANIPFIAKSAVDESVTEMNQLMEDVWVEQGPGWPENGEMTIAMFEAAGFDAAEKQVYLGVLGATGEDSSLLGVVGVGEGKKHARMVSGADFNAKGGSVDYAWPEVPHEDGRGLTVADIATALEVGFTATLPGGGEAEVQPRPWLSEAADRLDGTKMQGMATDVGESMALYDISGLLAVNAARFFSGVRQ